MSHLFLPENLKSIILFSAKCNRLLYIFDQQQEKIFDPGEARHRQPVGDLQGNEVAVRHSISIFPVEEI